jgi:hypothetical protein
MKRIAIAMTLLALAACRQTSSGIDLPDAPTSPQANAIPAPLEALTTDAQASMRSIANSPFDGGSPPIAMRGDRPIATDSIPAHDAKESKEVTGWSLTAILRTGDIVGPLKANEVSLAGIETARRQTEPRLAIDLAATHMRIVLATRGFALPIDTEIRARVDRYGHIVIFPNATSYQVAPPGSLRALLGERRLDVAPILTAAMIPRGDGALRLAIKTRRIDVETRAAKTTFEIAHIEGASEGGVLLCRALLDLMNADPSTPLCGFDDVPLHADFHWAGHGILTFDAIAIAKRTDLAPQLLLAPPPSLNYTADPPTPIAAAVLLTSAELAAFRTTPVDVTTNTRDAAIPIGLALSNTTDELRFVYVDGAAIAWVGPGGGIELTGLPHGRYNLQWRTLLGDAVDPAQVITVPGTSKAGEVDGGH